MTTQPDQPPQPSQGKGRPTPKRSEAQKKRPSAQPAPKNRKEAAARIREQRRTQAGTQRAAMRSGDINALPARERTPEKILARDFVDSRRSAGIFFLPAAVILFASNTVSKTHPGIANIAGGIWLVGVAAILVDSARIYRGVAMLVRARVPELKSARSAAFYAMSRSTLPRRWRMPPPRVKRGEPIPD